jgi:4-hydroxy-tetrahydrodipicolinate reductase
MGASIVRLLPSFPRIKLVGAVASERSAALRRDVAAPERESGVVVTAALPPLLDGADLVIDFSQPAAAAANLAACVAARVPLLLGTTGLPPELAAPLAAAAEHIPLLVAANTSIGVTLLLRLVRQAAQTLSAEFDIEIVEAHHRHKRDAPSGTALALGRAAAAARGVHFEDAAVLPRDSRTRVAGQIGFAVVRGGDVVGEHEVRFLGHGETLTLRHEATDRSIFARGALQAGQWLVGRSAGRYDMEDIVFNNP